LECLVILDLYIYSYIYNIYIIYNLFIYISQATFWKFKNLFGFLQTETVVSVSIFGLKKYIFFVFFFVGLKTENRNWFLIENRKSNLVSVFGFGLEAKTGCLCLLLRYNLYDYVILRSSRHKHHVTKTKQKIGWFKKKDFFLK